MKFPQLDGKTWVSIALGGTSLLLVVAIMSQWKYASLGKQVSRNVVKFLTDHGAHVEGGVVSGGMVTVPLKITTAVNSTILQMLQAVATQMAEDQQQQSSQQRRNPEQQEEGGDDFMEPEHVGRRKNPPTATSAAGSQRAPSGGVKPPSSTVTTMASTSPRGGTRPVASAVPAPTSPPKDDCGFSDPNRGKDHEGYNPSEFVPASGKKVSVEQMLADDGDSYQ